MLHLVRPTVEMKEAALDYKKEHFEYGDKEINGSELLDQMDSYEACRNGSLRRKESLPGCM